MTTTYITAEQIKVNDDEGRYCIRVTDGDGMIVQIDIHHIALEFYEEVQRELRPWFLEAEHARATMPRKITTAVEDVYDHVDAGYALDDPKHPTYHDRMVD